MIIVFFDSHRVHRVLEQAYVAEHAAGRVLYVSEQGGLQELSFGSSCQQIKGSDATCCQLLYSIRGLNTQVLDDYILGSYL